MRIQLTKSTGCPVPQFVVYTESEEEAIILKIILDFPEFSKDSWKFHLHGQTLGTEYLSSFNFGWKKEEERPDIDNKESSCYYPSCMQEEGGCLRGCSIAHRS